MTLEQDELHVWAAHLESMPADPAVLAADELARAAAIRPPSQRRWFLAARTIRRELVSRYTGVAAADLSFVAGPHGQLRVDGAEWLHFSHSRSGGQGVFALARSPVGVDLEVVRPFPDWRVVATHYFSPRERDRLGTRNGPEAELAFLRCWTVKEAYVKATGVGIAAGLQDVETREDDIDGLQLLAIGGDAGAAARWMVTDVGGHDGGDVASLVVPRSSTRVRRLRWRAPGRAGPSNRDREEYA